MSEARAAGESGPGPSKESYESKFRELRCRLDKEDEHFLSDPRILPCSNSACLECIKRFRDEDNCLKCHLCNQEHKLEDLSELPSNQSIIDRINLNSDEITDEIIERLNKYVESLNETFANREEMIEKLCEKAKLDISNRIEILKSHLDTLHLELLESLASIKEKVVAEIEQLNEEVESKCVEYAGFSESMQKMFENFEENREILEKDIYKCQDYIEDLKRLDESFHKILRKVSFEPSEWMPDESFIYTHIGKFEELVNLNDGDDNDSGGGVDICSKGQSASN